MHSKQNPGYSWKVLLIGGSSGVGKTVAARELAKRLSLSLLLLDDVRLALQHATSRTTHPDLHVFLEYKREQWRDSESIVRDWIAVGNVMSNPLQASINHHILVPDIGSIIIEGDSVLPIQRNAHEASKDVCTVFILEEEETRLLYNLQSRGRGFNELAQAEQEGFAHASWSYGQWISQQAKRFELPVINARPQRTLPERLLAVTGVE
ncbi:MAG TPA: hypothetical protein VFQ23_18875 [Anaerolineales bacterium]|nr:hypothetical protein [Anaerolineales bacterium]